MKRFLPLLLLPFLLPASAAALPASECPDVVPIAELGSTVGDPGIRGYTVSSGTVPEPFDVEVLGLLENQPIPGAPMIVARVSGAPIVDAGDTAAAGMSGSPIYLPDGRLLGALAYGFSGTSDIIGITPAELMTSTETLPPAPTPLSRSTRFGTPQSISKVLQISAPAELAAPFQKGMARRGIRVVAGNSSGRDALPVSGQSLGAGDTAVASLAVGRTSMGALGTATYVCRGRFAAFGHPLIGSYQLRAVLSQGDIFGYIKDPAWSGSFKLGVATNTVGTVGFDGTYGISGALGTATPTIPLRARIFDETNQTSFVGTMSEFVRMPTSLISSYMLSSVAGMSLGGEILQLSNRGMISRGSASGGWKIRGQYRGQKFVFVRSNAWNGWEGPDGWFSYGTLGDAIFGDLARITGYALDEKKSIRINSVDVDVKLRAGEQSLQPVRLSWRRPGGAWRASAVRGVPRGGKFQVRVLLRSNQGAELQRNLWMRRTADRGAISVFVSESRPPKGSMPFPEMLKQMAASSQNRLTVKGKGARLLRGNLRFDRVVEGRATLRIGRKPQ